MNRERHAYWSAYIADVQGRMKLVDWRIVLLREAATYFASVDGVNGQKVAYVRLGEDFDDASREEQRRAIVHELVHVHLLPMKFHLFHQASETGHPDPHILVSGHESHEEFAVDDLARIIAPHMPLPPKVKP